jgi:hypothetical protein
MTAQTCSPNPTSNIGGNEGSNGTRRTSERPIPFLSNTAPTSLGAVYRFRTALRIIRTITDHYLRANPEDANGWKSDLLIPMIDLSVEVICPKGTAR